MTDKQLNDFDMITQNPIIGRARKKLAGVYARTFYGKNILQSCPPSTKGKQTTSQVAACSAFGALSLMANQISASLLNMIYYAAPSGRSRRAQWTKDLSSGMVKTNGVWTFDPSLIQTLGYNSKVSETAFIFTPASTQLSISVAELSAVSPAIIDEVPLLILICADLNICQSLLDNTTLVEDTLSLENLSTSLIGHECYIFPLWKVNVGTTRTPVYAYGSFQKLN